MPHRSIFSATPLAQVRHYFGPDSFAALEISLLSIAIQKEVIAEVQRRRAQARQLRTAAAAGWAAARAAFEARLLG